MTDQLLYRLNRVPDRNYVKFLELIGVRLFPPTGAAGAGHVLAVRAAARRRSRSRPGTEVATVRTGTSAADRLQHDRGPADRPLRARRRGLDDRPARRSATTATRSRWAPGSSASTAPPKPGDALLVGLTEAVPALRRATCASTAASRASASTRRPAARLGGVDRRRLGGVRGRPRHDRRAQPRRRRRDPRARASTRRSLIDRVAGRLAAGAGRRARPRASRPTAPRRRSRTDRVHDRRHGRGDERRADPQRAAGRVGGRPRPALPAQARAGRRRRDAAGRRGQRVRRRLDRVDGAARTSPTSGPDDRHFMLDAIARRDPVRPGGAPGRRHAAQLRRRAAPRARTCACRIVPRRRRRGAATSRRGR